MSLVKLRSMGAAPQTGDFLYRQQASHNGIWTLIVVRELWLCFDAAFALLEMLEYISHKCHFYMQLKMITVKQLQNGMTLTRL